MLACPPKEERGRPLDRYRRRARPQAVVDDWNTPMPDVRRDLALPAIGMVENKEDYPLSFLLLAGLQRVW